MATAAVVAAGVLAVPTAPTVRFRADGPALAGLRGLLRESTDLESGDPIFLAITGTTARGPELLRFRLRRLFPVLEPLRRTSVAGGDLTGLAQSPDRTLWLVDGRGPSLVHLSSEGAALAPIEGLPVPCRRGKVTFEGVAYRDGHVYVFARNARANGAATRVAIAVDTTTERTVAVHRLPGGAPLGDVMAYGLETFLVSLRGRDTGHTALVTMRLGPKVTVRKGCYEERGKPAPLMEPFLELAGGDPFAAAGVALVDEGVIAVVNDDRGAARVPTVLELYASPSLGL